MPAREQRIGRRASLEPPESTQALPLACCNEVAAVEFVEKMRWGDYPACVHCGGEDVYRMTDTTTGGRNKRFLWRCRSCRRMFTVRIGTVFEDSRLELRHWCFAFWRACTSKEGVAAREIIRQCRISYKSALFLMHRVRQAMLPASGGGRGTRGTSEFAVSDIGERIGGRRVVTDAPVGTLAGRPGPTPETLKLGGFWQTNIAKALQKKRAAGGCPGSRGQAATGGTGELPAAAEAGRTDRTNSLDRPTIRR